MVQQNKHLTRLPWIKTNTCYMHQCDFEEIKMIWISNHIYTRTTVSTSDHQSSDPCWAGHPGPLLLSPNQRSGLQMSAVYGLQSHPDFPGRSLDRNQGSQVTLILLKFWHWCEIGMHNRIQQCVPDIDCRCIHGKMVSKVKVLLLLTCFVCSSKTTYSTW